MAKNYYSGFRYSDTIAVSLPFTFVGSPTGVYSGGCTSYISFVTPVGQPSTSQAKFWIVCLDSSATNVSVSVGLYVCGKWK